MKQCTLCNEVKPFELFNKNKRYKDGHYKHCKSCHYKVYGRNAHFKSTYGISEIEYNNFVKQQNYKCSVCESEVINSHKWSRLVVDHCHSSGKIRGFLCQPCNMALGITKDNPTTLRKLADYLEEFYGAKS